MEKSHIKQEIHMTEALMNQRVNQSLPCRQKEIGFVTRIA
jgi:hypothetical protein